MVLLFAMWRERELSMWKVLLVAVYLLGLSVYDYREKSVPIQLLTAGAVWAAIMLLVEIVSGMWMWNRIWDMIPGVLLFVIARMTGNLGLADGIVLWIVGVILGRGEAWMLLLISFMLVFIFSVCFLFLKRIHMKSKIPYIPFLNIAFLLRLLSRSIV